MIKHWEHKSRKMDFIFFCIILCFLIALSIDFYIKQAGEMDLLKIFLSSLFISIGFGIMVFDNLVNAKWLFGSIIVIGMFIFSSSIMINNLVRYIQSF